MVERRIELNRRYGRKKKMAKLKAKLAAAKDNREREHILQKIRRLSPWWTEPETAKRSHSYSDWGELVETSWKDGGIERQLVRRYDALSRLTATEERNDGITDPETVTTYAYDTGVTVSPLVTPTFVLGQLARATSASGQVTFSYDAFGRMNARVFTDNQGGLYIDKTTHSAGGRLAALEFNLPDQNHQKELVKYTYDSAGRLRGMTYVDASGGREIYRAENIDPFGRVQKATMGGHVDVLADYASEGRRRIRSASVESPTSTRRVSFDQFDPVGRELSNARSRTVPPPRPRSPTTHSGGCGTS